MFSIFAALFGGLYLAGRYVCEKATGAQYDAERRAGETREALVVNREFEEELAKKIANPRYRDEIEKLIKADLEYVYGDAWSALFAGTWCEPRVYAVPFSTKENIVLTLMLSKSGLIPSRYQSGGIEISNFAIANAYECLKILHCVENNVKAKKRWSDVAMIFLPYISYEVPHKKGDPGRPNYTCPCSGKFFWNFNAAVVRSRYAVDLRNGMLVNACKEQSIGERSLASRPYKDTLTL